MRTQGQARKATDRSTWPAGTAVRLPALPESIPEIRDRLRSFLRGLELDALHSHDIEVATVEAATNVVQHAYPAGESGSLAVHVDYELDSVEVVVCDFGLGPQAGSSGQLGLGLQMVAALSDDLAVGEAGGGGVEVWMRFVCRRPR